MQTITVSDLDSRLNSGEQLVLLDVREPWEFDICKIEGSINISMSNTEKMLAELKPEDSTIVICHHGMRSFQVANFLEQNGFSDITNLEGGIAAWANTIDTNMSQY